MTNALSLKPEYWRYFAREAAKGGDCPLYEMVSNAIADDPAMQAVTSPARAGQPPQACSCGSGSTGRVPAM